MFSVPDLCHKQTRCCSKMLLHDSGGGEGQVCTQPDRLVQHYTACPVRLFKGISLCCPLFTSDFRYLEITMHVYSSVLFPLLLIKPTRLFSCEIFAFLPHWCMTLTLVLWQVHSVCSVLQVSYILEASELLSTTTSLLRSMEAHSCCDWRTQIRAGWCLVLQSLLRTCWSGLVRITTL